MMIYILDHVYIHTIYTIQAIQVPRFPELPTRCSSGHQHCCCPTKLCSKRIAVSYIDSYMPFDEVCTVYKSSIYHSVCLSPFVRWSIASHTHKLKFIEAPIPFDLQAAPQALGWFFPFPEVSKVSRREGGGSWGPSDIN